MVQGVLGYTGLLVLLLGLGLGLVNVRSQTGANNDHRLYIGKLAIEENYNALETQQKQSMYPTKAIIDSSRWFHTRLSRATPSQSILPKNLTKTCFHRQGRR